MDTLERQEQAEIFENFERGRKLYQLVNSEGYQVLLDIFEAEVIKYEFRLLNLPSGSTNEMVRDILAHAKVARSIFEQLQLRIHAEIESGLEVAQPVGPEPAEYSLSNL